MLNRVTIIGNVGNVETRTTADGNIITRIRVATTEKFNVNNEPREITEWHTIIAFGRMAEFVNQSINKGYLVYVEGKLRTRSWDDVNGVRRSVTEIVAEKINILRRPLEEIAPRPIQQVQEKHDEAVPIDDDIPF
ncbi:MAG: single-stranded DNA-binding protein [Candidatus Methanomethylicaceae archaeon]